jgi:hypothetical protein
VLRVPKLTSFSMFFWICCGETSWMICTTISSFAAADAALALPFFVEEDAAVFPDFFRPQAAGAYWATAYDMLSICSPKKNNVTFVTWRK